MKKAKSIKNLKNELWQLCRAIALKIYAHKCYTCGVNLTVGTPNMQLGHLIPSSTCGAFLRHDLRNLRWQCYRCNINGGGEGAEYHRRMLQEIGQEKTEQLFKDKQIIVKADHLFYMNKIKEYKTLLEKM